MEAVGQYRDWPQPPRWHHVANSLDGILGRFLPTVQQLGVPFGQVAVLAAFWLPLYHLARELRARGLPVIGPGARPYKRSHPFALLAEPIGAYLAAPEPESALSVQRALFHLFVALGVSGRVAPYSYAGRVLICELLRAASEERAAAARAVDWLERAADRLSRILVDAGAFTANEAQQVLSSAGHMVKEIKRNGEAGAAVEDLGVFARPRGCIQLMTVHKAKGREFEAVALIEAHDGRFPHFTVAGITDPVKRQARYDESRRVVYVAATRAHRVLMAFSDDSHWRNRPSPFLDELGLVAEP